MKDPAALQPPANAAQLEQTIADLGRKLSASSVLLQEALAESLGLSATEIKCLDIIQRTDSSQVVTPGLLVERTGLTSGAVTGVLDRLEAARFVRREKSPADRRQIVVRAIPDRDEEVRAVYEPYTRAFREMIGHYEPTELLVVGRFVRESIELVDRYTSELRSERRARDVSGPPGFHDLSVPLGDQRSASLEIARGSSGLELSASDALQLYRLSTDGPMPEISFQHETLRFSQKRASLFDFKRHRLALSLNPGIPWDIRVRGDLAHARLGLERLWLTALEILGGLSSVEVDLPAPRGRVLIQVKRGANQLTISRPVGAQIGVVIHSGASGLVLDSLQLGAVAGRTEWQSPNFADASDRYEVEVVGGANRLSVLERRA